MTCEVHGCDGPARSHMLFRADGQPWTVCVCGHCLLSTLAGRAVAGGHRVAHVADHPLTPECRHPDARWVDDHCEIDGLEALDMSDLDEEAVA